MLTVAALTQQPTSTPTNLHFPSPIHHKPHKPVPTPPRPHPCSTPAPPLLNPCSTPQPRRPCAPTCQLPGPSWGRAPRRRRWRRRAGACTAQQPVRAGDGVPMLGEVLGRCVCLGRRVRGGRRLQCVAASACGPSVDVCAHVCGPSWPWGGRGMLTRVQRCKAHWVQVDACCSDQAK
jgi:hypothetical protein